MAVTKSTAADRAEVRRPAGRSPAWRFTELGWLVAASGVVAIGLYLAVEAKGPALAQGDQGLASKTLLNLNDLNAREDLLPALRLIPDARRPEIARKIYYESGGLSHVGRIRPILTASEFRQLKPLFVVRTPAQFRRAFRVWIGLFFAAYLLTHVWWSIRGFRGDQTFLPALLLLTGMGLILMISLRDPLRDQLLFLDFVQGVVGGCALLAVASFLHVEQLLGRLSFIPLLASFLLSALLVLFGSGPGVSDAKVNLLGFQPVEVIRVLLVLFLAGYFARRWDVLRHARETRPRLAVITKRLDIPPVEFTLPVLLSVMLALAFFFLQKDMGPALVFTCLFLILYGIARGSAFVPAAGLLLLAAGFAAGYCVGIPHTVGERVSMWLSPWDNLVHGGDQLAHSLWALATGGMAGMGIGLGSPELIPAAHTDLILSALGEEGGFLSLLAVFALYALLVARALRAALRASTDYELFLAAGLASVTAVQILLIAGGALGIVPLTGVATPFLSYGRSSMLANFFLVAILLSISARSGSEERNRPFRAPLRATGLIFAAGGAIVLAKAAWVQVAHDEAIMGAGALVVQADGARRYQYNPRFQEIMREIPKGTIYDRNGLPLATSNWEELVRHRADYQQLGIEIEKACSPADGRYYPLGPVLTDLLGDLRTRWRWGASNTSFVERDLARRLRGYDDRPTLMEVKNPVTGQKERLIRYDYRELVPLLRHRNDPQNPAVRRVLDRPRDVRMSVDARLQVKVAEILRNQLQHLGKTSGAAVVLDSATGDLLAAVSYPLPPDGAVSPPADQENLYLDRARYGLYPPGSTFKVVTAIAALRKNRELAQTTYLCIRLPDGRVGNYLRGSKRPVRDDIQDLTPHGTVNMERGLVVSCNSYFAQLGTYEVGAPALLDTANLFGVIVASPNTVAQLRRTLPQAAYGQGQVLASPFQMARVAATVANHGLMPQGRWITDESNARNSAPQSVLSPDDNRTLARFLREAVTSGTGRRAAAAAAPIAGKTGTAELAHAPSHAWFIGFAPYEGSGRKIAVSVLIENGVYGGTAAAPAAAGIVDAAVQLGLIQP
jgi:cell division protein FtsW (lipid II flippase)